MTEVSFLLVTYNSSQTIRELLESILTQDIKNYEVIIVDNASEDDTIEIITQFINSIKIEGAKFRIIRLPKNLGLCKAMNIAARIARGKYLCILDHDVILLPSVIKNVLRVLESNEELAVCQPRALSYDNQDFIDSMEVGFDGPLRGKQSSAYETQKIRYILWPTGCCFVIKREIWEQLGGYDEKLFIDGQDIDLGWRIWLSRYKIASIPSYVLHKRIGTFASWKNIKPLRLYFMVRNQPLIFYKNADVRLLPLYLLLIYSWSILIIVLSRDKLSRLATIFGLINHLKLIPEMIRNRFNRKFNVFLNPKHVRQMVKFILPFCYSQLKKSSKLS